MLRVTGLTVAYSGKPAVAADFALQPGDWLMVIGPNGAGKSTLLRAIAQGMPYKGKIYLWEAEVGAMGPKERAKRIGVLAQHTAAYGAFTVAQLAAMGRYAHRTGRLFPQDPQGPEKVAQALAFVGMEALADRPLPTLSGGELQRAFLAQVMAQEPNLLLLDEPSNHLDAPFQKQLLDGIAAWLQSRPDRAVISAVHDLSLARAYGSKALLLAAGRQVAFGALGQVMDGALLQTAYGMDICGWMRKLARGWLPEEGA